MKIQYQDKPTRLHAFYLVEPEVLIEREEPSFFRDFLSFREPKAVHNHQERWEFELAAFADGRIDLVAKRTPRKESERMFRDGDSALTTARKMYESMDQALELAPRFVGAHSQKSGPDLERTTAMFLLQARQRLKRREVTQ